MTRLSKQKLHTTSALMAARDRLAVARLAKLRSRNPPPALRSAARADALLSGCRLAATSADAEYGRQSVGMLAPLARELAHSINNVLGVARGNLHLMQQISSERERSEMLQDALGALGDLEALSSELELFAGHDGFAVAVVDFGRLLQLHADDFSVACGGCAIELVVEDGASPLLGLTDSRHFVAAVRGLIPLPPQDGVSGPALTIRCVRSSANAFNGGGNRGSIEISICSSMYCVDAGAPPTLMSRANGYLEMGMWFARQVAAASGGRFYHALDRDGYPTRMLFVLPEALAQQEQQ